MQNRTITIDVLCSADVIANEGVATGEPISFADELILDDVYQVSGKCAERPLALQINDGLLRLTDAPHHIVHLDSCLTLMGPDGGTHDVLILVEVEEDTAAAVYVLPLCELRPQVDYRLVGIARHTATKRFAEAASGSFARGTHITMADGAMRPIETLASGDIVLTRDAGRQPIKHVGLATLRATGSFAPVVIPKGALNNENDLVLRPDHRLFVYQRADYLGAGRAEVLVKARQLVDHATIVRRRGGYIDYFQLIFDQHHIIYAEGIAAESHLVDPRTRGALPEGVNTPDHAQSLHHDYEVKNNLIPLKQAAELLRKASSS